MKLIRKSNGVSAALLAALALGVGQVSQAMFLNLNEAVPVERLVQNISRFTEENPKDAEGYYVLGRIHSLAYARESEVVSVIPAEKSRSNKKLPGFAAYDSVRVKRQDAAKPLGENGLKHLQESVRLYGKAVELSPKNGLYWLGYGWMLEQGAPHAPQLKPAEKSAAWQEKSLAAFRQSFALTVESDAKKQGYLDAGDALISREAGEGVLRFLGKKEQLSEAEKTESESIKAHLAKLKMLPMAVTPLIVPLGENTSFAAQVAPEKTVQFDLLGDGRATRWPWVSANTGILVWDETRSGQVKSGRQLFGSVTWWIFWKNGYAALASLDDNGDGWLRDKELNGISIWRDANGNGISEPGEVRPVGEHGIAGLAVRGAWQNGVLGNAAGCELADGTRRPTYDWIPSEVKGR